MILPVLVAALTVGTVREGPRVAVVVGSNTAIAGRGALRYAHNDARAFAEVLVAIGGFKREAVTLLLDQGPQEVLAALDAAREAERAQGGDGLLVFYYSGHADDRSLYPGGAPLPLTEVRARLGDDEGVRVGIIDACSGGGWTHAKGLSPAAPFEVGFGALASEGTALLASSSGLEEAHEAESLQGSFFTHYLVAGLRGAAEANADGVVTLSEAYAYANRFTIRDTATRVPTPQHPSFDVRLRGRQDVALTSLANAATQLSVEQDQGPLQVVQLSTGVVVVEAAPGARVIRLALPPGPYLVRRVQGGEVRSREVQVEAGRSTHIEERALELVGDAAVASRGPAHALLGRHRLAADVGVAPLDAFFVGVTVGAEYTWFFTRTWAWRAVHLTYNFATATGLTMQLERDFNVLPTAFVAVRAVLDSTVRAEPVLLSSEASELRASFDLGPALLLLRDSSGRIAGITPGLSAAAGLLWVFRGGPLRGLGLRLGVQDSAAISSGRMMHLAAATLGVTTSVGPPP